MITKLDLRENLNIPVLDETSDVESFQNQTLRPILKLQNEIYLTLFGQYAIRHKADYPTLSIAKKKLFIEQSLQKDLVLKNTFLGITLGLFTAEEMEVYTAKSKDYNRRIFTMLIERIKSQAK